VRTEDKSFAVGVQYMLFRMLGELYQHFTDSHTITSLSGIPRNVDKRPMHSDSLSQLSTFLLDIHGLNSKRLGKNAFSKNPSPKFLSGCPVR
jgi:hypothetical protein